MTHTTDITVTAGATLGTATAQLNLPPNANPAQLLPHFLEIAGQGNNMPPELALQHWNQNPYIPDTPNWTTYTALKAQAQAKKASQFLKLPDVPIIRAPSKRRMPQPRLKISFETLHDASMRLAGTLIFVGQKLYYVRDIHEYNNDYLLLVDDEYGKTYKVFYKDCPDIDLRSPEPQYFSYNNYPAFLLRQPIRQQRQGLSNESLTVKIVGTDRVTRADLTSLLHGMTNDSLMWAPNLYDVMVRAKAINALRLSKNVALFTNSDGLVAEYKGRVLGVMNEDTISVDDDDFRKPWIRRDIAAVGCSVRMK